MKYKNTYPIFSSYYYQNDEDFREEYKEVHGTDPTEEELSWFVSGTMNIYWDDFIGEIKSYEKKHGQKTYIISGTLGLWNGTPSVSAEAQGMEKVINICLQSCDEYKIEFLRGVMRIVGHHHDGTNIFYIRELTDKGADYLYNHPENYQECFRHSRYTHRVSMFDLMYYGVTPNAKS